MCGIFGYIGSQQDAASRVLEGLKRLEYRGYDSWGVAVVGEDDPFRSVDIGRKGIVGTTSMVVKKKSGKIGNATVSDLPAGMRAIGHTRWATHGGASDINAHPHLDCQKNIAIIHNGIVENYEELKAKLLILGHAFISETDTEVIAHSIEENAKIFPFSKAVEKTFSCLRGMNAIIAMHRDERVLVAATNGSPLVMGFGRGEHYLASDPAALAAYTDQVYFLEDGEMAIVRAETVSLYTIKTGKKVHPQKQRLQWDVTQTEKGAYPFFMRKEMDEQPGVLERIASHAGVETQELAACLKQASLRFLVGCGSSSYECMTGTYLFSKIATLHVNFVIGSEMGHQLGFLTAGTIVLALSQSGETMDILELVKTAKAQGAMITALVNVQGSTLYRVSDRKILLGVGPEKSVASTKACTGKIAHLILLAYAVADRLEEGREVVRMAAESSARILSEPSMRAIQQLATQLLSSEHIYVIGRGLSYPASLETAMKIKEISYIHAEGLAAGELKHGTLALIDKGTPCIVFLPNDETYQAAFISAMEMKARGGYVIGVSFKPHAIFDVYIEVKDAREGTIIPQIVFAQALAYFLTIGRHLDPDMPRNLAKSVTVR